MLPTKQDETKVCKNENNKRRFPDGDYVLVIQHFLSQFDETSFPRILPDHELDIKDEDEDDFCHHEIHM